MYANIKLRKMSDVILWAFAIVCFLIGIYVAVDHSLILLTPYNYLLGPLGDDAYDAVRVSYPILTGEDNAWHLLRPFADHRVVMPRLLALFDFNYANGTGSLHGLRFVFVMWLICCLLIKSIFAMYNLNNKLKTLLSGVVFCLIFANVSLINYYSAILFTWPQVILYSLLAFIFAEKYCSSKQNILFFFLTSLSVILGMFTFNIGLVLWPIVFMLLYKRNAWKTHLKSWLTISGLSYLLYFSQIQTGRHLYWKPGTLTQGIISFFHHPLTAFDYFSRIVSIPMIPNAQMTTSFGTCLIGIFILCTSIFFLLQLLRKSVWNKQDCLLFSCLAFSFAAIMLISIARFSVPAEFVAIGSRFSTPGLLLWISLILNIFNAIARADVHPQYVYIQLLATMSIVSWLLLFVLPGDNKMTPRATGDMAEANRYFITLASEVPITENYVRTTAGYNIENSIEYLTYLNNIQKQYHKSAYAFWPANAMNTRLTTLGFRITATNITPTTTIVKDFRNVSPAIYFNVSIPTSQLPNQLSPWYIVATDYHDTIVGFALRAPIFTDLTDILLRKQHPTELTWKGAMNANLAKDHPFKIWLANDKDKIAMYIGSQNI